MVVALFPCVHVFFFAFFYAENSLYYCNSGLFHYFCKTTIADHDHDVKGTSPAFILIINKMIVGLAGSMAMSWVS